MINYTKHQHTIPGCYLRNFSEDGYKISRKLKKISICEDELIKELNKKVSIKSSTVIDDFYTLDKFINPMIIETDIYANTIENKYTDIYNILTSNSIFDMSMRTYILMFFLSMYNRTPKQFEKFLQLVPSEYLFEKQKIINDYKVLHIKVDLQKMIEAHQFKIFEIIESIGSCEFITCDNPVLIVNKYGLLVTDIFKEKFNINNTIIIPINNKKCLIMSNILENDIISKNFYNKILYKEVDNSIVSSINLLTLDNADKYYFGKGEFFNLFFKTFKFI